MYLCATPLTAHGHARADVPRGVTRSVRVERGQRHSTERFCGARTRDGSRVSVCRTGCEDCNWD
eukprot:7385075-Prymnesium_polylepis.1